MDDMQPADKTDLYIDALKALISPGVYAAPLESSPLIDLPVVVRGVGHHASPGARAREFIAVLERVVSQQLRKNDRTAAEMLFALSDWTGKPAQERRDAVAKLRDRNWTWEANYRKDPLQLDLRRIYLAISREDTAAVARPGPRPAPVEPGEAAGLPLADSSRYEFVKSALRQSCAWARKVQNKDGGLPSDNEGSVSCTWSTAGLLWAMAEAGEDPGEMWRQRALTWVLDHGNQDRGIPIVGKGDPSITDATAQTLLAANACYRSTGDNFYREQAISMTNWLMVHQESGAGWAWRPGTESGWVASTCFALLALDDARSLPIDRVKELKQSVDAGHKWLLEMQNSDCGWGSRQGDRSRAAITGLVLHTLSQLDRVSEEDSSGLLVGALDFIMGARRPDGTWPSTVDRPTGHTITRSGDAYCLLGTAAASDDEQAISAGITAAMKSYRNPHFQYEDTVMHSWPTRDGILALAAASRRLKMEDRPVWNKYRKG